MKTTGFFLVLEGPEGAGKSTLGAGLATRMRAGGVDPVLVREPGGTVAAESMRALLLDAHGPLDPRSELLYLATARSSLVDEVITPALAAGRVVMSDRFDLSTMAYQIGGRGLDAVMVEQVNRCATKGLRPDLTLVLDLWPELG
nr:dTMP kinase [Gemmatimonadales bacterium]